MKTFSNTTAKIRGKDGTWETMPMLRGMTAYEVAVRNGFTGTEDEWLSMMLDDGWVTKCQALDAGKANKDDVYSKSETLNNIIKMKLDLDDADTPSDAFLSLYELTKRNDSNLVIERITSSCTWKAPKAVNSKFTIFAVGGGGSGGFGNWYDSLNSDNQRDTIYGGSGGSGHIIKFGAFISEGTPVNIIVGAGGIPSYSAATGFTGNDGGATSILSHTAPGGSKGGNCVVTSTSIVGGAGGDGGAGGGGGGCIMRSNSDGTPVFTGTIKGGNGGNASYGGGGGGGSAAVIKGSSPNYTYSYIANSGANGGISVSDKGGNGGTPNAKNSKLPVKTSVSIYDTYFDVDIMSRINDTKLDTTIGYGQGAGGVGSVGGNAYYGGGGGGGYCSNGCTPTSVSGGGGGGHFYYKKDDVDRCTSNSNGGSGFFSAGGHASQVNRLSISGYNSGSSYYTRIGGGGGGFFSDGKSNGTGGDGGVLIMYIKED